MYLDNIMDRTYYFDELVGQGPQVAFGELVASQNVGGVMIPKSKFIKEHVNLLQILKSGTKAQRKRELKDQLAELAKVLKKKR